MTLHPCDSCGLALCPHPDEYCAECSQRAALELEAEITAASGLTHPTQAVPEATPRSPYVIPPNSPDLLAFGDAMYLRRVREAGL